MRNNIRVLAGGTDLIPSMRQKLFEPEYVLDLRGIAELRGIRPRSWRAVEIGALTALSAIEKSPYLRQHFPVLTEAAATVAFARTAQHGHARRQYLSRYALPLVQPVADLAQGLRFLHQEGWQSLPRRPGRNEMLGGVFRRYAAGVALSECGH